MMACCLFCAKQLPEPMLLYYRLDLCEHISAEWDPCDTPVQLESPNDEFDCNTACIELIPCEICNHKVDKKFNCGRSRVIEVK